MLFWTLMHDDPSTFCDTAYSEYNTHRIGIVLNGLCHTRSGSFTAPAELSAAMQNVYHAG